jgi:hypothetical protein
MCGIAGSISRVIISSRRILKINLFKLLQRTKKPSFLINRLKKTLTWWLWRRIKQMNL